jgi:hypothetical protein
MAFFNFKKNLNTSGRVIRLAVSATLLAFGIYTGSKWLLALSLFTFLEFLFSFCVVFALFGINQCKVKK